MSTLTGRATEWFPSVVLLVTLPAAVVVGFLSATALSTLLVLAVLALVVALVAWRWPDIVLAAGSFAALAGGGFSPVTSVGQWGLVLGGVVTVFKLSSQNGLRFPQPFVLAMCLWGWLALRVTVATGALFLTPLFACLGAVLLSAAVVMDRNSRWLTSFTWAAVIYLFASWGLGGLDPTGLRFEGISGNANRFTFGALVAAALLMNASFRRLERFPRIVGLAGVGVSIAMILDSGSDQGTAGLILLGMVLVIHVLRLIDAPGFVIILVLAGSLWAGVTYLADVGLSPGIRTLSGRTALFEAGWANFLENPVVGTGMLHIVDDANQGGRSPHNSIIGIAAATGILGLSLWVALLVWALKSSLIRILDGHLYGAAVVSAVTSQFVQQIELVPLGWTTLLLCAGMKPSRKEGVA